MFRAVPTGFVCVSELQRTLVTLVNRVGVDDAHALGSADAGFHNVTLASTGPMYIGRAPAVGHWRGAISGRAADQPLSATASFTQTGR